MYVLRKYASKCAFYVKMFVLCKNALNVCFYVKMRPMCDLCKKNLKKNASNVRLFTQHIFKCVKCAE